MKLTPYLYFKGSCEAALRFYEACGLGAIKELRRYEGTPMVERHGSAWANKVPHSVFEGPSIRLCALFDALSRDGLLTVPFKKQFWGEQLPHAVSLELPR